MTLYPPVTMTTVTCLFARGHHRHSNSGLGLAAGIPGLP